MSNEFATAREAGREAQVWSLCWQAAVGRDFVAERGLSDAIRKLLIETHGKNGRALISFVILPTELHIISRLGTGDTPESIARAIGSVLSRLVRSSQGRRGAVLEGRYSAHELESPDEVREEVRMLAWRPLHMKVCSRKHQWPQSSFRLAIGMNAAKGFNTVPLLLCFGESSAVGRTQLRKFACTAPTEQQWRAWELMRGLQLATGSVCPGRSVGDAVSGEAAILIAGGEGGIDGAIALLERWIAAKLSPTAPVNLHVRSDPLAARGRSLLGCLAMDHGVCSAAAVARYFDHAKATISEQMTLRRSSPADRLILQTPPRRIVEEVAELRRMNGGVKHRT